MSNYSKVYSVSYRNKGSKEVCWICRIVAGNSRGAKGEAKRFLEAQGIKDFTIVDTERE